VLGSAVVSAAKTIAVWLIAGAVSVYALVSCLSSRFCFCRVGVLVLFGVAVFFSICPL